ncbi:MULTISPECIES: flagellar hook-basal body complex protein [Novosphingobium]|uniref:Flagellar hook protein FlgE n=1 Tax=Novosphingobium decolorationis TaxID=2698673 RepID=A0ABX8E9A2_9SPHN|nr:MULTISPECIES: flagellar hook basal-body protein [Novosphingobium]MED5544399.1 flagellar hook basal-body protein [Pseudomonadota bacterium]QVM85363.1 flagellar hook basal-body protein [Novosphingobium decolorationis]GAM03392.1 flagellar hook protein FlgE [Novosphingobium sp. MBES04]
MSYYTSLTGLKNAQTDLNVIAHNIANAETTGFKKSDTAFADIVSSSILTDPSLTTGIGARVSAIMQEFSLGPIEQTGSALDVAVNGEGFYTVVSPLSGETAYTRAGSFSVDGNGYIRNAQNMRLQVFPVDASGAITSLTTLQDAQIPAQNTAGEDFAGVTIMSDGSVVATYADGSNETVGVLALANFISPQGLRQEGNASWTATGISGAASYGQPGSGLYGSLMAGSLERSNVEIAEELVSLITAQRNFQANAKAVDTATQLSQTIINLRT